MPVPIYLSLFIWSVDLPPRFANQAERPAARKAHVIDGSDLGDDSAEYAAAHGKVLLEIPDLEQTGHGTATR